MLKWSLGGMTAVPVPTVAHVPFNMQKCDNMHQQPVCRASRRSLLLV